MDCVKGLFVAVLVIVFVGVGYLIKARLRR